MLLLNWANTQRKSKARTVRPCKNKSDRRMKSRENDTIPDGSKHTRTYRTDQTSQPDLKETAAEKMTLRETILKY